MTSRQTPVPAALEARAKLPPPEIQEAIKKLTFLLKEAASSADDDYAFKKRLLDFTVKVHDSLVSQGWHEDPIKPAIHAWFRKLGDPSLPWDGQPRSLDLSFFRTDAFQVLVDQQLSKQGGLKRKVAFAEGDQPKPKKKSAEGSEESSAPELKSGTKRPRESDGPSSSRKPKVHSDSEKGGDEGIRQVKKKKADKDNTEEEGQTSSRPSKKPKASRKEKVDANDIQNYEPTDLGSRCSNCRRDDKTCWKRKAGDFACWTCFKSKLGACDFSGISRPSKKKQSVEVDKKSAEKKVSDIRLTGTSTPANKTKSQPTSKASVDGPPLEEPNTDSTPKLSDDERAGRKDSRQPTEVEPTAAAKLVEGKTKPSTPPLDASEVDSKASKTQPSDPGKKEGATTRPSKSKGSGAKKSKGSKVSAPDSELNKNPRARTVSKPPAAASQDVSVSENEDATYIPSDFDEPHKDKPVGQLDPKTNRQDPAAADPTGPSGRTSKSGPSLTRIKPAYRGELQTGSVEEELHTAGLRLHQSESRNRELSASVSTVVRSLARQTQAEERIPRLEEQLSKAFHEISELRKDLDAEKKRSEAQIAKLKEQETTIVHYANNINLLTSVVNKMLLREPTVTSQPAFYPGHPISSHNPATAPYTTTAIHSQMPPPSTTFLPMAQQYQAPHFPVPGSRHPAATHASTTFNVHPDKPQQCSSTITATAEYPQNASSGNSSRHEQVLSSGGGQTAIDLPRETQNSSSQEAGFPETVTSSVVAGMGGTVSDNSSVGTPDWPALGGKVGRPGNPLGHDMGTYINEGYSNPSFALGSSGSTPSTDFFQNLSSVTPMSMVDFDITPVGHAQGNTADTMGLLEGDFGNAKFYQDQGGTTGRC